MYKRIVVAVGDEPERDTALAYAIALAAHTDAELCLLRVLTVPLTCGAPDMVTCSHLALEPVMEAQADVLACAVAAAEEAGVSYTTASRWGAIPDVLMRTAEDADCEVIVVGAPGCPGWPWPCKRYLARHVVVRARQPVLVVAQPPPALYGAPLWTRLLVVHDGSPGANRAVEYALTFAADAGLDTYLLRLRTRWASWTIPARRDTTRGSTSRSMVGIPPAMTGIDEEVLAPWGGSTTILETAAKRGCDVIVLGTAQGLRWHRLWQGHIARALMATTDLPLLVINRFTTCKS
jgi:nucleotide-binding universal stress UspA family protein